MNKKEVKRIDPESINNNILNKLINNSFLVDEIKLQNYELFNVVSETGDSIYFPSPTGKLLGGGQVYVSIDKIRDIVNEELEKRLGMLQEDE
jgi:hypothetical protein